MSKMGISTLQSYCAAQLWEAVGLSTALIDRHFTGTPSRVGGIGIELIAWETLRRHNHAFDVVTSDWVPRTLNLAPRSPRGYDNRLDPGGEYQFRIQGEHHNWNPLTIAKLQHATRGDSYSTFKEFSALANDETRRQDRKSTRLNSSHSQISYAVFCLKKKKTNDNNTIVSYYTR